MLVPLETLSGWPQVTNPTPLQVLLLLVGFPLLVFIVVVAISKIATSIHAARGDDINVSDPLWVGGGQASGELEAASANPGAEATDQAQAEGTTEAYAHEPEKAVPTDTALTSTDEGDVEGDDTGEHVGGAGARW
jgi:hypothetical protein